MIKNRKKAQALVSILLVAVCGVGVLSTGVRAFLGFSGHHGQPRSTAVIEPPPPASGNPPFALEFAAITSGGSVLPDGSIVSIGQPTAGTIANDQFTIDVGAVPVLLALSTGDGDLDDDGLIGLTDFDGFQACYSGPGMPYPNDPSCWRFDMDRDDDVDLDDFEDFQHEFTGE